MPDSARPPPCSIIGDEILSGRTKDKNIGFIADTLTDIGIDLEEVADRRRPRGGDRGGGAGALRRATTSSSPAAASGRRTTTSPPIRSPRRSACRSTSTSAPSTF